MIAIFFDVEICVKSTHSHIYRLSLITPCIAARSISLTTLRFQVHTNQDARQRLDRTVDATHYTNTTTQSLSDATAQTGLKPRFACPYHKAGILVSVHHRSCEGPGWNEANKVKYV